MCGVADGHPLKTVTPVTARRRRTLTIRDAVFDELEQVIPREMERGGLAGLALAPVKDDDIVWLKRYGLADHNVPAILPSHDAKTKDSVS